MALNTDSAYVYVNVQYRVGGLNETARSAQRASTHLAEFAAILTRVGLSLIAFRLVDRTIRAFNDLARAIVEVNVMFDKAEVQLRVFMKGSALARRELQYLAFQSTRLAGGLQDMMEASTALATFGMDSADWLELVADTAQATNRPLEDVAIAFGRILSNDRRWRQFIVTRRGDLAEFIRVLEKTKDREQALNAAFERFLGVSKELEGTLPRSTEKIKDTATIILKIATSDAFAILRGFVDDLANAIQGLVFLDEKFNRESEFVRWLGRVSVATKKAAPGMNSFADALSMLMTIASGSFTGTTLVGAVEGFFFSEEEVDEVINRAMPAIDKLERRAGETLQNFFKRITYASDVERKAYVEDLNKRVQRILDAWTILEDRFGKGQLREKIIARGPLDIDESKEESLEFIEFQMKKEKEIWDWRKRLQNMWFRKEMQMEEDVQKARIRGQKIFNRRMEEMHQRRLQNYRMIADFVVEKGGFLLFGGTESNKALDKQIEALQEELDIINGVTTPLTRQEELMNRIVELESQRVGFMDRAGRLTRELIADMAKVVAKAAILNALNRGGGGMGFMDFLKQGLNIASTASGNPALAAANMGLNMGADMSGGGGGGMGGVGVEFPGFNQNANLGMYQGASKIISINNPVFLGNDMANVVESAETVASRRAF